MPIIYTPNIRRAIKFSIKTHEVYQKQKRKGKDIAYITHPMTVGIILALAKAPEDVIVAGILHDTIEDCVEEKKVDCKMITERFGKTVAALVMSVTEKDKTLPWEVRKKEAVKHIARFSHESLLVKSADLISNMSELLDDHNRYGDIVFERFSAPKEKILKHYLDAMAAVLKKWPRNPLSTDLKSVADGLIVLLDNKKNE
jgi:(p)ppGpp synthase/HD superfamily hydrolase